MNDLTIITPEGDEEPRVFDISLAERLGMINQRDIRTLIAANRAELESFGSLSAVATNPGPRGGRPGTAYYLNEEQALLVASLSRTELIRKALVP